MSDKIKNFFRTYKWHILTIALMVIIGTSMHFVVNISSSETYHKIIAPIFPISECSFEHMKMFWYPFLVAGIVWSIVKRDKGYLGGFIIGGFFAMMMGVALFAFYQSITIELYLILDIIEYMSAMIIMAMLSYHLSSLSWVKKGFYVWIILALIITAGIVYLAYNPGSGYLFKEAEELTGHEHTHLH
ncbi:MAG: DUF6512 family protein [Bacilli bacterium]|nr:DUF6512 family protein [Bacilli bacterium]